MVRIFAAWGAVPLGPSSRLRCKPSSCQRRKSCDLLPHIGSHLARDSYSKRSLASFAFPKKEQAMTNPPVPMDHHDHHHHHHHHHHHQTLLRYAPKQRCLVCNLPVCTNSIGPPKKTTSMDSSPSYCRSSPRPRCASDYATLNGMMQRKSTGNHCLSLPPYFYYRRFRSCFSLEPIPGNSDL